MMFEFILNRSLTVTPLVAALCASDAKVVEQIYVARFLVGAMLSAREIGTSFCSETLEILYVGNGVATCC